MIEHGSSVCVSAAYFIRSMVTSMRSVLTYPMDVVSMCFNIIIGIRIVMLEGLSLVPRTWNDVI